MPGSSRKSNVESHEFHPHSRIVIHIFIISTLVLSNILCVIRSPFFLKASLSSSVTLAGNIVMRANVPAALRFDNVPGLMTRTDFTTCVATY